MAATNTASLLPLIPRIFFVYLEPVIITTGIALQYTAADELLAFSAAAARPLEPDALIGPGLQASYLFMIMLYGLMVLLVAPPSKKLAQLHVGNMILADMLLWSLLFYTMARVDPRGWAGAFDPSTWSPGTRSLVFGPAATFSVKVLTLAGAFGKIRDQ